MSGEWIEWKGGECSLPMGTLVQIRCRDGVLRDSNPADAFHWDHQRANAGADIIRYRVVATDDSWIEWNGGECPVAEDMVVDITLRNGASNVAPACMFRWEHTSVGGDIVRYRICNAQPATVPEVTVIEHPLTAIFAAALAQVTNGKGAERHANGAEFMDQPWRMICDTYGSGFAFGQCQKKLIESQGMSGEARKRELLGAVAYLAMGILHEFHIDK